MDRNSAPPAHEPDSGGKGPFSRLFCHEMPLYDMFGGPVPLSFQGVLQLLSDWKTLGFVSLIATAIYGVDPHAYRGHMPEWQAWLLWQIGAATLVVAKVAVFAMLSVLTARGPKIRIWLPLFSVVELTCALLVMLQIDQHLLDQAYDFDVWDAYAQVTIAMLIIELLFVRFLLSSIVPVPDPTPRPAPPATVQVGGRQIRLDQVRYIASEEHYVRVATHYEEIVERAKLADLVAHVEDHLGIRSHRSWWVSRYAKPALARIDGKLRIQVTDGLLIPVARSRERDVQAWFDMHRDW